MAEALPQQAQTRWPGFKYEQVPGLANRLIARYLRYQRKNMIRFFTERGLVDLAERMRQIKNSRQGMMAKNRMFQEVLNEYARQVSPQLASTESAGKPGESQSGSGPSEAVDGEAAAGVPAQPVVVLPETIRAGEPGGDGVDASGSVPMVAREDGSDELVIEE
jgi:hypothetical protein